MRMNLRSFVAAAVCGAVSAPGVSLAATYFESRTTTEGDGPSQNMGVRAWVDGPRARVEFVEGGQAGFFNEGSYMLTPDGGDTLYLVNPAEQSYTEVDLSQMMSMASSIMEAAGGVVQMEFGDFTNEKIAEEPGEEILGYDTTRYEYETGYTMSMGVLGFSRETRTDMHQEFWCTDELDAEGFEVWLSPDRFRTGNEEVDALIEAQFQELDCLPLRSRVTTTTSGDGGGGTSVTTNEVTVLRQDETVEPGMFELPEGYEAVSMPELPGGFGGAGAAGDGEAQEQEEERGIGGRLRDLLNR